MPFGGNFAPGGFGSMGGGGPRAQTFHFSSGGMPQGFSFSNPQNVFENVFRDSSFGGDDIFGNMGNFGSGSKPRQTRYDEGATRRRRAPSPEVTTVERQLPLTLEELFKGTHKKMKIKRKTFDEGGKRNTQDRILEMDIKPGLKAGSKIKFKGVGDQEEGGTQDLHFIISEVSDHHVDVDYHVLITQLRNLILCLLVRMTTFEPQLTSTSKRP